ncbi:mCG147206 [Mus musculus]|nr:mCG147206 [Mus musculus]
MTRPLRTDSKEGLRTAVWSHQSRGAHVAIHPQTGSHLSDEEPQARGTCTLHITIPLQTILQMPQTSRSPCPGLDAHLQCGTALLSGSPLLRSNFTSSGHRAGSEGWNSCSLTSSV